ncbi:hypothetical protein AaE_009625 [Aphanomyces astaci]|uniref:Tyrosine-protein kinase catalytic domain-containing protein n=1 Tax=Aphanomyces astaci TaxID=112090 RepID=A0A6A5A4E0_APHAT|nr:hypothetical protein AaE_009625 [Aphanomyces astaci]
MSSGNLDGVLVPIERPEYENQGSMELGVMVGITLGIVLGIVGMVAYWCRLVYVSENAPEQRRGTNPRAVQAPFSSCLLHIMGQQGSIMPVETTEWMLEYRPSVPLDWHDLEAYRLDIALVERTTRLATGGFGSVWLGRFNQQQVAVKSMVEGRIRTSGSVQRFINEVTLMAKYDFVSVIYMPSTLDSFIADLISYRQSIVTQTLDFYADSLPNRSRMLLSELDTHKVPFDGMTTEFGDVMVPMAVVMKIMQGQIKVAPSPSCPPPIALLLNHCTQFDPMLRPTAVELLHRLQQLDVARL